MCIRLESDHALQWAADQISGLSVTDIDAVEFCGTDDDPVLWCVYSSAFRSYPTDFMKLPWEEYRRFAIDEFGAME